MKQEFPDGEGIFETIKTINGVPAFLNSHIARAKSSAEALNIEIPNEVEIRSSILKVLELKAPYTEFGRLRIEFLSSGEMQVTHATYEPWVFPAKVRISKSQIDERDPKSGHKRLPYRDNLNILSEAESEGFDEVIRLNMQGMVCEGATSNLLFKIGSNWVTPVESSGCLPGTTRALALEWFDVSESEVAISELEVVQSGFILSSLRGFQPIGAIGHRKLLIDHLMQEKARTRLLANSVE